ncbi:TcmI family type II polyketide cyclase [Microbacterium sp. DT81.1]|uniref:TcmI family type II polyketide cyclase n=1 Tax=Microbacterium sp. DT81.1 TaxID=3393413 RepID=UPI003CEB599B
MHQTMIVAKMRSEDAPAVAEIFSRSDATSMPQDIGVIGRSLYRFHGIYVHLIDFARPASDAMRTAAQLPSFRAVSDELRPYIEAYDPNWTSPADAMADRFYHWTSQAHQG